MTRDRWTAFGLVLLGAGVATSAVLGPLVLGRIAFHVSRGAETQLVGGEIVSLIIAAPGAIIAAVRWVRGSRAAPALAFGPAAYAVYMYVQYVIGPQYERYPGNNEYFFPLYLALIALGWMLAARAWAALRDVRPAPLSTALRRAVAVLLLVLGVAFALTWARSIAGILGGARPAEYNADPTLFWIIRLADLAFVIPMSLAIGGGLLRDAPWARRVGLAFTGFETLVVGAVAAMAIAMAIRHDPASSPALIAGTCTIAALLAIAYALWLRASTIDDRTPAPTRTSTR